MKLLPVLGGALAAACLSVSTASAATITRHFEFVASTFGGPLSEVTGTFSLTFDPLVSSAGSLDALSISEPSLTMTVANTGFAYSFGGTPQFSNLVVGGTVGGVGSVSPGASDFVLSFLGAGADPLSPLPLNFAYSTGDGEIWSGTFQVSTYEPPPSAVPEPGAWAMMIVGFGLAGTALRRRALGVAHRKI
ncbi:MULTISPECIES: PEPxxWA-CTERM sorting domain-containing protein [Phenylobacterium]|uniref:Ice-binding protein C-terminal domain-containing protein n=1 Tax=Phenylobacterium koreense TaxID=266125 RepID=A0ABV2EK09_9CAUL